MDHVWLLTQPSFGRLRKMEVHSIDKQGTDGILSRDSDFIW